MKIVFKLFASLTDYLPAQGRDGNVVELDVARGTTITHMVQRFSLPDKLVHLVLLNGAYVAPEQRSAHVLKEGDALAIWPPIAGG
ncbi:MAG: MoaD/ThiS family protein [Betaproteobacteria bacterium]